MLGRKYKGRGQSALTLAPFRGRLDFPYANKGKKLPVVSETRERVGYEKGGEEGRGGVGAIRACRDEEKMYLETERWRKRLGS